MILVLEDSSSRLDAFRAELARIAPGMKMMIWSSAHAMIREADTYLAASRLISLDHDLIAPPDSPDPGDGLDVTRFLVSLPLVRPVIVHSSNSDRSRTMMGEFELAGWPCTRVLPLGENWVQDDWATQVTRLLKQHRPL